LPGTKEEEAPTSTTLSHVNLAPAALFLAPLPGTEEEEAPTSTTLSHVNLAPADGELADRDAISPTMSGKGAATAASRAKMSDDGEDAGVKEDDGDGAGFSIRWFRWRRARGRRERRKEKEWGVKR
jgi:hypothetical protein